MADVVAGQDRFALDLYGRLRHQPGNLFLSPSSIAMALAIAYAGARGETARQMAATLHFTHPPDQPPAPSDAPTRPAGGQGCELSSANALWGQEGLPFRPEFLRFVDAHYGAGLNMVDFRADPEAARRVINAWVERRTGDRIKDLIGPSALDPSTRLVLTNAIYFKAAWAAPFPAQATRDDDFRTSKGAAIRVRMMEQTGTFGYFDGVDFEALELPYRGGDLSMVVVLPKARAGLGVIEGSLAIDWLPKLAPRRVAVALPEFKVEAGFELQDALQSLGMKDAFSDDRADFSGMTGTRDLSIAKAIHKAFVDVNEEGTEAAAATAVVMKIRAVSRPVPPDPLPGGPSLPVPHPRQPRGQTDLHGAARSPEGLTPGC